MNANLLYALSSACDVSLSPVVTVAALQESESQNGKKKTRLNHTSILLLRNALLSIVNDDVITLSSAIRFSPILFLELVNIIDDVLRSRKIKITSGRKHAHDLNIRIYLFLWWMRGGMQQMDVGIACGIDASTISRYNRELVSLFISGLEGEIQWPSADKRSKLCFQIKDFPGCVGFFYQIIKIPRFY